VVIPLWFDQLGIPHHAGTRAQKARPTIWTDFLTATSPEPAATSTGSRRSERQLYVAARGSIGSGLAAQGKGKQSFASWGSIGGDRMTGGGDTPAHRTRTVERPLTAAADVQAARGERQDPSLESTLAPE